MSIFHISQYAPKLGVLTAFVYYRVLRYAGDIYTELILRFAKSINNHATTLFKAKLSPHATGAGKKANGNGKPSSNEEEEEELDTEPKKLEWNLTPELRTGIRFAETRLSDLICQNDIVTLEFDVSFSPLFTLMYMKNWLIQAFLGLWKIFHYKTWILAGCFRAVGFPGGVLFALWSYRMHIRTCNDEGFPARAYRVYSVSHERSITRYVLNTYQSFHRPCLDRYNLNQ